MNGDSTASGWYYAKAGAPAGQQLGPIPWEQLSSLAQTGMLAPTDLVWNQQLPQWLPAGQVQGLFPATAFPGMPGAYPAAQSPYPAAYATGGGRSWLPWLIPLVAVLLVGGGLGAYFGLRGHGDDNTGSTLVSRTTTTPTVEGTTTSGGADVSVPVTTTTAGTTTSAGTTTTAAPVTTTTAPLGPSAWVNLNPAGSAPPSCEGPSLAYDTADAKVILFGGWGSDSGAVLNETWAYNPAYNTWVDLKPTGSLPSSREDQSMVYAESTGKVILFGGSDNDGDDLGDTWAYDPVANTWTNLNPGGSVPRARDDHAMVYDSGTGKVILFGGWDNAGAVSLGDTWAYDPAANTWSNLNPAGAPAARDHISMAYDSVAGKVILFGGWGFSGSDDVNDTWAYDPAANTWTNLNPAGSVPPPRDDYQMAYDSATGKVILFGGEVFASETDLNDTWAYDYATNTWANLNPAGSVPPVRADHSMTYDSGNGTMILFGGSTVDKSTFFNDTWAFGPTPAR